jgi:hypothetical protein
MDKFLRENRAENLNQWKDDIKTMEPKAMNMFVKDHFADIDFK